MLRGRMSSTNHVFPFVVGRGRSGTTLVRAMLDSHPDMAVPPESHFLVRMARRADRYKGSSGFEPARLAADLPVQEGWDRWGLTSEDMEPVLAANTVDEAFRALYGQYARKRGKTRYADKTPDHVMHVRFLSGLFPESRFVHVIRDGRDVALSFRDAAFGPKTLLEAAVFWRRFVEAGRRAGRWLGPGRYLEIRYEDFVEDAPPTLERITSFLDLPFDEAMLRYYERADEIVGNLPKGRHTNVYRPPVKNIRDWRREMTRDEARQFESVAGDLLAELGYETSSTRSRPGSARLTYAVQRWRITMARRTARVLGRR